MDFLTQTTRDGLDVLRERMVRGVKDALAQPQALGNGRIGYLPPPRPQYAPLGPPSFLVYQKTIEGGRERARWKIVKGDDPGFSAERIVDEYLADDGAVAVLIFQGQLIFRDLKVPPGAGSPEDG